MGRGAPLGARKHIFCCYRTITESSGPKNHLYIFANVNVDDFNSQIHHIRVFFVYMSTVRLQISQQ